jgi:hypothetical protein
VTRLTGLRDLTLPARTKQSGLLLQLTQLRQLTNLYCAFPWDAFVRGSHHAWELRQVICHTLAYYYTSDVVALCLPTCPHGPCCQISMTVTSHVLFIIPCSTMSLLQCLQGKRHRASNSC